MILISDIWKIGVTLARVSAVTAQRTCPSTAAEWSQPLCTPPPTQVLSPQTAAAHPRRTGIHVLIVHCGSDSPTQGSCCVSTSMCLRWMLRMHRTAASPLEQPPLDATATATCCHTMITGEASALVCCSVLCNCWLAVSLCRSARVPVCWCSTHPYSTPTPPHLPSSA